MTDKIKLEFLHKIQQSIAENTLVRITLSKPKITSSDLAKILIKPAIIRKELMLSFVYRHKTKDITKNFEIKGGLQEIEQLLENDFMIATLFSTVNDWIFQENKKGKKSLRSTKATFQKPSVLAHDKQKNHLVKSASYLTELGVTDSKNRVQKDMGDKFKQINKFVEIIAGLLKNSPLLEKKDSITVTDMGAGKGYLTFAVYDYLVNKMNLSASVRGVEVRPDLIKLCNAAAQKIGFEELQFVEGYIGNYDLKSTDILIALHACDTATDDAISKGIKANAELIICAPCCHKQIRKAITGSETLAGVMQYGILQERQAEIITDTIRALIMESQGYKTKVFEFISTEHTGKNLMIVGVKKSKSTDKKKYLKEVQKLKKEFGIKEHYLETLLRG